MGGDLWHERTLLVIDNGNLTGPCYIDAILRPIVLPFLQQQPCGVIYHHDKVIPHRGIKRHWSHAVNVLP